MLLLGTVVSGYYVFNAFLYATAVKGYHAFLLQVVCQKRKPQIDGLFLSILHIVGKVKFCLWRARLLEASADRCYHALKIFFYYILWFTVVTMHSCTFLHAAAVKGYHVFKLKVVCKNGSHKLTVCF